MTQKQLAQFIAQLNKLAAKADKLNLTLGNGGQVGSILGAMADDLKFKDHHETRD